MEDLYSIYFYETSAREVLGYVPGDDIKLSFMERLKFFFLKDRNIYKEKHEEKICSFAESMREEEGEALREVIVESSEKMMARHGQKGYFLLWTDGPDDKVCTISGIVNGKKVIARLLGDHGDGTISHKDGCTYLDTREARICYWKYKSVAMNAGEAKRKVEQIVKNNPTKFPCYAEFLNKKIEDERKEQEKAVEDERKKQERVAAQKRKEEINKKGIIN